MQLYTINATPVMSQEQFEQVNGTMGHFYSRGTTVEQANAYNCEHYALSVSDATGRFEIEGFTMQEVVGYWQGEQERSFKIEIALDSKVNSLYDMPIEVYNVAMDLKAGFNQDSVMVTLPDNTVKFI